MNYLQKELYDLIKTDNRILDFILHASLDGLWYWDLENREQEWMNASFWETLGYDPAEMPHLASAWQGIIHPDDLAAAIEKVDRHLADPTAPYDQIVRYTHKNGSTVYVRCRGMAIRDQDGNPMRLLGAHVDVTEAKRREILLEEVNRVARIGVWEVDLEHNKSWWSDTTKAIHGVPPDYIPSLVTGINFYKEGESREKIQYFVQRAIENGTPYDTELQLVDVHGREIWVRAIGQADRIKGKTRRLYGVFLDIDERKRNENKLLNYHILEAKAREMEQFAYAASHDLREPLLTITGYLDIVEEDLSAELPADLRNHLNTIKGAAKRMDQLIQGMMDYSRLSQVKQLQSVDLNQVVADLIIDLNASIQQTNAMIEVGQLPTIMAYPLELKILVQNLLSNALKFVAPAGERPEIRVGCRKTDAGYELSVHDNGIGIDESNREKVFQLFRRLHTNDRYSGMGIGLANVKKIAELHGGSVRIEGNAKGGTSVYVKLNG